jgi:Tol biopolymer transport system component/DNA-binding winged helix-turn-helix (wHTH) protein
MVKSEIQIYRFGEFQLDAVKRVLLRENAPVQLPSRAFDVLLALVERNQCVIDRDELMRLVWGGRVVEENNLTRHISTLRKALAESPNDHHFIVTVPGRGYSFVAEVERAPANGAELLSGNHDNRALHIQADGGATIFEPEARPGRSETATIEPQGIAPAVGKSKIRLWATMLVLLLASTGLLVILMHTRSKPAALNSYRDWEIVKLTNTGGSVCPAISPDGKYLVYVNKEPGRESIWLQQLVTFTQQQLTPPDKVTYYDLLLSPDGGELYFVRGEGLPPRRALYRMPALGGVPTKLRDDIHSHIALSHDGARLCFTRRDSEGKSEFIITDANGVEERVLAHHLLDFLAWSPDGKAIAFSVGNAESGGEDMSIHEIRLDDGATREISAKRWDHVSHKAWLPDGSGLIVCGRARKANVEQLWFVAYPSGDARPLSNELDRFKNIKLTEDAGMMVAEQFAAVADIWRIPLADMANAKKVGVWGASGLCILPDGRIVYSVIQAGRHRKAWIMNADGTQQKQLTTGSSDDGSFAASPDGRFIVFASNRTGHFEIWRMNTDGSALIQLTNSKGANHPSVSPDGRWVIYLSSSDGYLYKFPIEGGAPRRVAGKAVGVSAVSPDGKLIAYFAPGKETWRIAVSSFKDGSAVRRFEVGSNSLNNTSLKWTPDGKALLYSVSSGGVANIWMQPLDGGPPRQVTDFKADGIFRFDMSSDGKTLVCARGGWKHDIVLFKNLK